MPIFTLIKTTTTMNVSNILSVSFDEKFISKLNNLGFSYERELERMMDGHYAFQHRVGEDICISLWIGIDWKGRIVIDCVYQNFLEDIEENYYARNLDANLEILKSIDYYISVLTNGHYQVFSILNELPKTEDNYEGAEEWIERTSKSF